MVVDPNENPVSSTQGNAHQLAAPAFVGVTAPSTANLPKPNEEVWVENKTADNRVYYYNARTRESAWTKPTIGPNVRVITQEEVERMAAVNNQLQQVVSSAKPAMASSTSSPSPSSETSENEKSTDEKTKSASAAVVPQQSPGSVSAPPSLMQQPPPIGSFPPFMSPGMFPPRFPGMPPPFATGPFGAPPFGMPPFGMPPFGMPGAGLMPPFCGLSLLDDSKFYYSEETKKEIREIEEKLTNAREESVCFSEHDSPDSSGKKYYYNSKTAQSVWEKPKCLTDVVELENKLQELKKKRIEKPANTNTDSKISHKEAELSEEEKARQRSKPISSTPVPGSPWCVVWTRDKRVFFFNPSEKVSLWERPAVLIGRTDVDRWVRECPADAESTTTTTTASNSGNGNAAKKKPAEVVTEQQPPVKKNRAENNSSDADENCNREGASPRSSGSNSPTHSPVSAAVAAVTKVAPEEFLQKSKIEASKEAAIEAEHKAAQVRAQLPLEERMRQFKELLQEKEVSAYATWERELQKIVFDPRYLLLTSKERKAVFDKYVRDRADEEKAEKAAALKRKREDFRALLREAGVTLKNPLSFAELCSSGRYAKDERFKAVEKLKDRESMYNDYLTDLARQEKEDKHAEKEKARKGFYAMLKEMKSLHRHSSWTESKRLLESDTRYKAIESNSKREDYFRDYVKGLEAEKETEDKISSSHKDKEKNGRDRDKDRDREHKSKRRDSSRDGEEKMDHDGDRHESKSKREEGETDNDSDEDSDVENEAGDDQDTDSSANDEAKRKQREREQRAEASLRERTKEVKEQLSQYESEREREREQLRRDEAIESFRALLLDLVKLKPAVSASTAVSVTTEASAADQSTTTSSKTSSEISWKEAKKLLKKDPRWSYTKVLDKERKQELFDEHMSKFRAKKRDLFYQLLDETSEIVLKSTSWKEAKKLIKSDARYEKLHSDSSFKMEREYETYVAERLHKAKHDFKELLLQTKLITYKTAALIKEQPGQLKEIEELLANDKSYLSLQCVADERRQMLLDYVDRLESEGPPPPPTATEPSRRK